MVDYSASLEGGSVCDQKRMERAEPNPTEGSGSNRREEDAARGLESKPDELALPSVRPDDPQILPPRHSLASISAPSVSSTRSSAAELSVPSWRPSSSGGSELTTSSTLPKLEGGLPSGYQNTTDPPSGRESASAPVPQGTGANWEELEFEGQEAVQQAEGGGHIAVDSDDAATTSDAGYESDAASSASTSLLSAVRDYTFENGRRYHRFREGRYNFPNDDVEQEREDMKHAMVKMLCQTLHFAPIGDRPQQILDIGTGTGIWAIEMADQFPSATVLGIDLSPIQPEWVPPNVKFMVDDAESQWLHPRNHFDYIHSRHTVMAIKDWPRLLSQAFE
ncbi:hypothetical protein VTK73DRAFT_2824 [Phialemonium thermophilum]|uniref:Methyltransferase domain-containing protein n=1 Tax=Phialemonium thermophilum TaxID=223376 RepID=A0ABR3X2W0_9PEZI